MSSSTGEKRAFFNLFDLFFQAHTKTISALFKASFVIITKVSPKGIKPFSILKTILEKGFVGAAWND